MSTFAKLSQKNGSYSLPYLIHLYNSDGTSNLYAVNNTEDITYNGVTYSAAAFDYTPSSFVDGMDGGGKLEIAVKEHESLVDFVETSENIFLDVIGILSEDGEIDEISTFKHKYGTISGDRTSITFTYEKDDRLEMTFPALIWNYQNNRGNS